MQATEILLPRIETLDLLDNYGKFAVEPLDYGYGVTLGNALRRVLLSSITGAAVTHLRIEGVLHEFATIPGVKEDTTELILNIKDLHVRILPTSDPIPAEERILRVNVSGEGIVTGADVHCPPDCEVVNPGLVIATMTDPAAHLSMELFVEEGRGYVPPDKQERYKGSIGVLPIGAIFSPVRKVNFSVEPTRVGRRTDLERLILEVWTNGTIRPGEAISEAAQILDTYMRLFADFSPGRRTHAVEAQMTPERAKGLAAPDSRIEELDFSVRTYNCLRKERILTVADLVKYSEADLIGIRNFGRKSLNEVKEKLAELNLSLKQNSTDAGE
jgi:DNA-directed RNA polymerase subunit alpha